MGRKKLVRILEACEMPNIIEANMSESLSTFNKFTINKFPLFLELGCGKGDLLLQFAQKQQNTNFIGVDTKSVRLWSGAKKALDLDLDNILFVHGFADELAPFFKNEKAKEIWIFFPDPHPGKKETKKRLISPAHLDLYKNILTQDGIIHFKTDDSALFDYSVSAIENCPEIKIIALTDNFYSSDYKNIFNGDKTRYEEKHIEKGELIKYISFQFQGNGNAS